MRQSRRDVLRLSLATASIVGAGCTSTNTTGTPPGTVTETDRPRETPTPTETSTPIDPDTLPGYIRPSDDPEVIPPELACEDSSDEFYRPDWYNDRVRWGSGDLIQYEQDDEPTTLSNVLALRVAGLSYELGETVTIRFWNVSGERVGTKPRDQFVVQLRTTAGWQSIHGYPQGGPVPYTDDLRTHEPGEGFEWELKLDTQQIMAESQHAGLFEICPDLQPGRYRFVFLASNDEAIPAVAFDVSA